MSVIEDTRKVVQDLVAPDLKAIQISIANLEKSVDHRFAALERSIDQRFSAAEDIAKTRHDLLLANFDAVIKALDTDARLIRLETQLNQPPTPNLPGRSQSQAR